jgi:CRISPR system Cascade subunit CasD
MGVRVDREGRWVADYHTVGGGTVAGRNYGVANARGGLAGTVVSLREYLADADFLVGLAGEDEGLLEAAAAALADPVWPLYLGRRSFTPAVPPSLGVHPGPLERLLAEWPWTPPRDDPGPRRGPRLVLETAEPGGEVRHDCPVSFASGRRAYRVRRVVTSYLCPETITTKEEW